MRETAGDKLKRLERERKTAHLTCEDAKIVLRSARARFESAFAAQEQADRNLNDYLCTLSPRQP